MSGIHGSHRLRSARFFVNLAVLVFAAASVADAQEGGGLGAKGKGRGKGPPSRSTGGTPPPKPGATGTEMGWIMKFDLAKEGESENLLGILSIKPLPKGSKAVKLRVRKTDESLVQLANHSFQSDTYADVLRKGLLCSADWNYEETEDGKKKSKQRELRSLRFETIDVKGRIEEISDEYVVIKSKPTNDRPWPDMKDAGVAARGGPLSGPGSNTKPKPILAKKVKLRIIEEAASFLGSDGKSVDAGEFETNQDVEATIVYGRNEGILVSLRAISAKSSEVSDSGDTKPRDQGGSRGSGRGAPPG